MLFSAAIVFVVSKTLDFYKSTMSWYLNSWLIIPIYVFPILVAMTASFLLTQNFMVSKVAHKQLKLFLNFISNFTLKKKHFACIYKENLFKILISILFYSIQKNESCGHKVILFINGNKLFWTVVLLIGTLLRIRSSFTIMLIILPTSVGALLIATLKKLCSGML